MVFLGAAAIAAAAALAGGGCRGGGEAGATDDPAFVVRLQRDALARMDFREARRFAATELQDKFDDSAFGAMILRGYPALAQTGRATTTNTTIEGDQAFVDLRLETQVGAIRWFRYALQREDGAWRIVGVAPFDPPRVAL